jgi:cobalt-zinc-cadmium efflux system outer membrane protein
MQGFRRWLPAGVFVLASLPAVALADPAPAFPLLLREAQATAPRLAEGAAEVRVARGLAEQAAARPNPTLGFEAENLAVHDTTGVAARQDTLSVSQALELGGKRTARMAAGRAEVGAAQAGLEQRQADFAADLAIAYAAAEAGARKAALLREDLGRAQEDVRAAEALVKAGKEADVRAGQARANAAAAQADVEAAQADAAEALSRLSSLAGAPAPFTGIAVSLRDTAQAQPLPAAALPADAPVLVAARAAREAAARQTDVERSRAAPDLTVSVGARRYEGIGGTGVVAGLSLPLPLFDRNRGNVAAASGRLAAADARLRAAQYDAGADWRAASAQARAGQARLKAALEAETVAADSYRLTRIGYDAGRTPLIELLGVRRALLDAQTRVLNARFARIRAEATLAKLAGRIPFGE